MSKRSSLITQITTNLAAHSNVTINSDLPYDSAGEPLYNKNMNVVYVGEQDINVEELIATLDQTPVLQTTTTIPAYLSVDAKSSFGDIDTIIANLLVARNVITGTVESDSSYETAISDDVITYTFEYNFITV
tara:strand:- start:5 stop:400 length:396 start_codon:yes stop_codon:yes gene_type:complete